MSQGTIKTIVSERGFGFIRCGQDSIFFHVSELQDIEFEKLQEGMPVSFDTEKTEKGIAAINVRVMQPTE